MDNQKTVIIIIVVLAVGLFLGAMSGQATRKLIIVGGGGSGCTDRDGDGYYKNTGCGTLVDCNDDNPSIHPNAVDICQDGIDQNCNYVDEACTTTTIEPSGCYDSDGGQNIYIKGYVTNSSGKLSYDHCLNRTLLGELYCPSFGSFGPSTAYINCPNGYLCNDGACKIV